MTRFYSLAALALLGLACGGPAEEWVAGELVPIGTTQQAIFLPDTYGTENGTENGTKNPECSLPWTNGLCSAPDNKNIIYKFYASTCTNWWQARFVEAVAGVEFVVDNLGDDWQMQGPFSTPGGGEIWNYRLECADIPGTAEGEFVPQLNSNTDNHSTPNGTFIQYRQGTVSVDAAAIQGRAEWSSKTDAQRQNYARYVITHELLHLLGFGHVPGGSGVMGTSNTLNFRYGDSSDIVPSSYSDRLRCYNEDSGTGDDC